MLAIDYLVSLKTSPILPVPKCLLLYVVVCLGLTSLSTIFQSNHNGVSSMLTFIMLPL